MASVYVYHDFIKLVNNWLFVQTAAADRMEKALELDLEAEVLDEQVRLLSKELRTTTQRVNLFEKVKIPETKANIKRIGIFLGDEQVNAVVRSKISKKKLQAAAVVSGEADQ